MAENRHYGSDHKFMPVTFLLSLTGEEHTVDLAWLTREFETLAISKQGKYLN